MLKFFEHSNLCSILFEFPVNNEDYEILQNLFSKPYSRWHIDFGYIYTLEASVIDILYKEIFEKDKKIEIVTYRYKLSRYLHKLGFDVTFKQFKPNSALNLDDVELVLIGGSADSTLKIIEIVKNITLTNLTLVIVQHIEKNKVGDFDKILSNYTNYKVTYVKDGENIKKGVIYLAPNNKHLKIKDEKFVLCDDKKYNFAKPSISLSYESFSTYYQSKLLVIQECGYNFDGVDKLEYLKENKTKIIIQDETECEAKSMVITAFNSGFYHHLLNIKNIILYLKLLEKKIDKSNFIQILLDMIFEKYGYDFRLYQMSMIERRLNIFMLKYGIKEFKDTIEVILFDKKMFREFFAEISINVTELFRNPAFFSETVEFLNDNFRKSYNIKIWSAGCSSGEEVYSIAILLKKNNMLKKSIIYATDFNKTVLEEAKNGFLSYDSYNIAKQNYNLVDSTDDLDKYFIKNNNFIKIKQDIQEKILFFQHNLAIDSSFNEFDTIICKNVIIYFNIELQKRVFELFYNSLKFGGFLIIGESEQLHDDFKDKFENYSTKYKVFKKVA